MVDFGWPWGHTTAPLNIVSANTTMPAIVEGNTDMRCSWGVKPNRYVFFAIINLI
jgi:hypothetical protein